MQRLNSGREPGASGTVIGTLVAESRLELQATCRIEGDIRARRMQLEEGAILNGTVHMGDVCSQGEQATSEDGAGLADRSSNKQTFPQYAAGTRS